MFLGDVTINGIVEFNNCDVSGSSLTIGSGNSTDGLNVIGSTVNINIKKITVNSSRSNYSIYLGAETIEILGTELHSNNNPSGAGIYVDNTCTSLYLQKCNN